MRKVKLSNRPNKVYRSKWTEVLEMIEEDETNNSNGPIESLEGRETLELIKEDKTINFNGLIIICVDKRV